MTAKGVKELSKKEKGLMGMDNSVGIAGRGYKGLNGNRKNTIKEHYAKWNKPGGEGQIPYDLTFN